MNRTSRRATLLITAVALGTLGVNAVLAQFGPPATVFGSIADSAGPVPEGLKIEAYIGETECSDGHGRTQYTGVGQAQVTVYAVDVVSREQRAGCGSQGAEIRIKVGDRFAPQTLRWGGPGFVRHDITFGSAAPAAIPTFTPAVSGSQATSTPPPDGSTATATSATPANGEATPESTEAAATATQRGGVTSSTPDTGVFAGVSGGDGGFPAWGIVLIALGALAAIGGGAGFLIARNQRSAPEDDFFAPPGSQY